MARSLGSTGWRLEIASNDPDQQTVLFHYPQSFSSAHDYLKPAVKIEMGARSDHWPTENRRIESYLHQVFPEQLPDAGCPTVNVLAAERTFWEKATILHAEAHRDLTKTAPDRTSRHYYDLAQIAKSPSGQAALKRMDLMEAVVRHKSVFFRSGWAKYDLAKAGSFRLVPPAARIAALKRDYALMQDMFFGTPPEFEAIMETLATLEAEINEERA